MRAQKRSSLRRVRRRSMVMPRHRPPRRRVAAHPRVRRGAPGEAASEAAPHSPYFHPDSGSKVQPARSRPFRAGSGRSLSARTGEAPVLDGRRRPGGPDSPPRSTSASARTRLCRVPEDRRSEERPHAAADAARALRRKPGGADSRPRTGPHRCEEDLMQPGELSRVKELAPKGVVPDGATEAARCRALRAINRLPREVSSKDEPEVFHFSTTFHSGQPPYHVRRAFRHERPDVRRTFRVATESPRGRPAPSGTRQHEVHESSQAAPRAAMSTAGQ